MASTPAENLPPTLTLTTPTKVHLEAVRVHDQNPTTARRQALVTFQQSDEAQRLTLAIGAVQDVRWLHQCEARLVADARKSVFTSSAGSFCALSRNTFTK